MKRILITALAILLGIICFSFAVQLNAANNARRLEILFLGHQSKHHNSELLADIFTKEFFKQGINITYTTDPNDLNEVILNQYDGLILYANHDSISKPQEAALLNFVKNGKGFIPLHCASHCFRNSPEVVELIGGQFSTHGYDSFQAVITKPGHVVLKDVPVFTTKDETYIHKNLSKSIEVLTERMEGGRREPYTWVRSYGAGRVFYTAYGHDKNTFYNKDFLHLVRNGILWAVGEKAAAALAAYSIAQPQYSDAVIPNYERRDPPPKFQSSLSPQESMSLMQVPVGFELQLFAAEPDVVNPIYMNWDERGRLWVIETVDYPNEIKDDDIGDDRIKILEDTNGDGKADKFTVFADHLNIPTSFVFTNGGIVVSSAPSFLFLKDTTGDDKADIKQTLLHGWGKWDTHAQASNLRYGFDNNIWGVVGYSGFKGKLGNDSLKFSQGIYRFTPNGKMLDFLSSTSNNTWGLGFSEENDVFISTANNTHSGFFGIPKKYLDKANSKESGVEKIDVHYGMHVATKNLRQVDVHGGFTAAAGHSLYTGRTFPKEYWNRVAFVNEPTGRIVHKHILRQEGAGFKEDGDGWNMLASADEWAAPIQTEPGPDGALWVVDWYDFIIQHNPTPTPERGGYAAENGKGNAYINPLRDHERGRIYRIAYKDNDEHNTLQLDKNDVTGLVKAVSNKNLFWRMTAQRLLVEKGDLSVLPALYKLIQNEAVDEIGINAPAIHALWTIHGLKALNGNNKSAIEVAKKALSHPAGGVRRAAIQVLPKTGETIQAFIHNNLFSDKDLRVRLAAVLAATEVKATNQLGEILVAMTQKEENTNDVWIRQALTIASKVHTTAYKLAADKKGLNASSTFATSSMVQRLTYGTRFSSTQLKTTSWQNAGMNPEVALREIAVSGNIQKSNADYSGLLMAHGNKSNGYAVYFKEGSVYFLVNRDSKQFSIRSTQPLPPAFAVKASLEKNGRMRLFVDDKEIASANGVPLFTNEFETTLRTALENKSGENRVTDFEKEFPFNGSFSNLRLETLTLDNSVTDKTSKVDQTIVLKVVKDVMKFDKEILKVKAGTTVQIVFQNPDFMQHNFVLTKPKTLEIVGAAADKLAQDPNGIKLHYVPRIPQVLQATPLVNPGGKYVLTIKVPDAVGDYPYVCTFPGHWRIMKGVMQVRK